MDDTHRTPHKTHDEKPKRKDFAFGISLAEWLTAAGLGIASGLATSAAAVSNLFHEDIRDATAFKKHFDSRLKRLDAIQLKNYETPVQYWTATIAEKVKFHGELKQLESKFRGVSNAPIVGTIDRFRTLSPRSKQRLYFNGAVGTVVGAAMALSFFNGVATRDKIDKIAEVTGADKER